MNLSQEQDSLYPPVTSGKPRLRIGVTLDSFENPAWIYSALEDIKCSEIADIVLVIMNTDASLKSRQPAYCFKQRKALAHLNEALYRLYQKLDQRLHPQLLAAFEAKELLPLLKDLPVITMQSIRTGDPYKLACKDPRIFNGEQLDVLLNFSRNPINDDVLNYARYGVWSYYHGGNSQYRGEAAPFAAVYENNLFVSSYVLQKIAADVHRARILYQSYSATPGGIWQSESCSEIFWKSSTFVMRCLRHLYEQGAQGIKHDQTLQCINDRDRIPTTIQMLPFLMRIATHLPKTLLYRLGLRKEQWFFAYRKKADVNALIPKATGFSPVIPPKGRMYADPFPIRHDGKDYIFFEEMEYQRQKGHISYLMLNDDGQPGKISVALSCDYHLSYPFIFEWQGEMYMIPETCRKRAIQLFRAKHFPDQWEFVCTLLNDVHAADITLFEHKNTWYMFTNISECGGSDCDELFIFIADTPLGPWYPHPQNPVKSDVRSARSAGNIFRRWNRLIRPAQDCSVTYGHAVVFLEITTLTRTHFHERIVGRIEPNWIQGLTGTHTYNASQTLEVIDGKKYVWQIR